MLLAALFMIGVCGECGKLVSDVKIPKLLKFEISIFIELLRSSSIITLLLFKLLFVFTLTKSDLISLLAPFGTDDSVRPMVVAFDAFKLSKFLVADLIAMKFALTDDATDVKPVDFVCTRAAAAAVAVV